MLIFDIVPGLSMTYVELATNIVGIMGGLALIYAVLLEAEKRQDAVFVVSSASLFVYALARKDYILMFVMLGIFLVAGRELVQIMRGKHVHTTDCIMPEHHLGNK